MSSPRHTTAPSPSSKPQSQDDETDYGSDFSDGELQELNSEIDRIYGRTPSSTVAIEDNPIINNVENIPLDELPSQGRARVPRSSQRRGKAVRIEFEDERAGHGVRDQVAYPDLSSALSRSEPSQIDAEGPEPAETEVEADPIEGKDAASDTRPPIIRYRAPPKKSLSVTDLVSPAWCELQYSFDLSRHGRKKSTPAMKMGTVVHEKLEREVYTTVPIETKTKEEKWGLKLWNVISGLGILAETGMTRELEVWGVIGGELVGGVIDEVSLTCPNPALEEQMRRNDAAKNGKQGKQDVKLEQGQSRLDDFMLTHGATTISGALSAQTFQPSPPPSTQSSTPLLYITDVKTRKARSVPNDVSARPTRYQLMLYNRLLTNMSRGAFDFQTIADHYKLNIYEPFSDSFIAQIVALDADLDLLLSHNSLFGLWSLVPGAFAQFAHANSGYDGGGELRISPILTAEYRDSTTGAIRGTKTFLYSDVQLDAYLENGMQWWRGERPARGVEVEEAFKCQICQFAPECEWRIQKVEEARGKSRARVGGGAGRAKSGFAPVEVVDAIERP